MKLKQHVWKVKVSNEGTPLPDVIIRTRGQKVVVAARKGERYIQSHARYRNAKAKVEAVTHGGEING